MPLKPDAQNWTVLEQVIRDEMTGLSIQFEVMPDGEPWLRLFGKRMPHGNREVCFSLDGHPAGFGTATQLCRPAWMTKIEEAADGKST